MVEIMVGPLRGTTTVATAKGKMGAEIVVEPVVGTEDGGITVPPINAILKPEGTKVPYLFAMALPISCLLSWAMFIAPTSILLGKFAQERA